MSALAYDCKKFFSVVYMAYYMWKCPTEGVIYPTPPEYNVSKFK